MNYTKINDKLYLVEQEIVKKNTKTVQKPKSVNHIFIYDRSGSMYGYLNRLAKDLKERLRTVQNGDTITLGWFSSPGEFRFPLKGLKITGPEDFKALDKVIDANSHALGSTCFSEILSDASQVVQDLRPLGNTFALTFLTDGYPTVYPYEKEVKAIHKAIEAVAGDIAASLLVGYGNYYNKELMADMAERFGGSLIHSSDLSEFPIAFQNFMSKSRDSEPRMLVELAAKPHDQGAVFSVGADAVNVYQVENGAISFSPTKNASDFIYILTDKKPKNSELVLGYTTGNASQLNERFLKAQYAAAYVLTQRTKVDQALDVLSVIGDKAILDRVNNAFTNSEYGAVEQAMLDAIGKPQTRFAAGQVFNYLPKPDAFCVLDALELLMNDEKAEFWPQHDAFEYKRIGPPSITDEKYPKFKGDAETRCNMSKLTWNDSKLNLSVLAKIDGSIDLSDFKAENGNTYRDVGLKKTFDTYVWRNYAIIKDGFLNTNKLPVSMSKGTYVKLLDEGVIDPEHNRHYEGRPYVLHLDRLPIMNRAIAEDYTSAVMLAEEACNELLCKAALKVLNHMREQLEPKSERGLGLQLTPEQEEFLKEVGVTRNGYNPPSKRGETSDFYMAKEFELKIKGMSSLPKIDDIKKKVAENKSLTPVQDLIAQPLAQYAKCNTIEVIDANIAKIKVELSQSRAYIQRAKFAVILGKKWFNEFSSRENCSIKVVDREVSFILGESRVNY